MSEYRSSDPEIKKKKNEENRKETTDNCCETQKGKYVQAVKVIGTNN